MDCRGASMNQDESVALWRRGKDAWNAWAEDMLRQKAELEQAGVWNGDKSEDEWSGETCKWNEAAQIDLSRLRFMTRALADTAEKQVGQPEEGSRPADANIKTLVVECDCIDFNGFVFPRRAWFSHAQFHGDAQFLGARFHGPVGFVDAQFHEGGGFEEAQFDGPTWFSGAQFHGEASFQDAQFHGEASFQGRTVSRDGALHGCPVSRGGGLLGGPV